MSQSTGPAMGYFSRRVSRAHPVEHPHFTNMETEAYGGGFLISLY